MMACQTVQVCILTGGFTGWSLCCVGFVTIRPAVEDELVIV